MYSITSKEAANMVSMLEKARDEGLDDFLVNADDSLLFIMRYLLETNMANSVNVQKSGDKDLYWRYVVEWK